MALPSPSKQSWNEETRLGQGKVYSPAQTTTLLGREGGGEKWEKLRQIISIVLRALFPLVASKTLLSGLADLRDERKIRLFQSLKRTM